MTTSQPPAYTIGIDLGTTNSAVSYVRSDTPHDQTPDIRIFDVPQLTGPGVVEKRPLLPPWKRPRSVAPLVLSSLL